MDALFWTVSDEDVVIPSGPRDVPVIEGYWFFDQFGDWRGELGSPNRKTEIPRDEEPTDHHEPGWLHRIIAYPIPAQRDLTVDIESLEEERSRAKIWLEPAIESTSGDEAGENFMGKTHSKVGYAQKEKITEERRVSLNLADLPGGPYRLYVKIGEHLMHENIYHVTDEIPEWAR